MKALRSMESLLDDETHRLNLGTSLLAKVHHALRRITIGKEVEITLEDFPHQGLLQFWFLNDDVSGLNFDDITLQDTRRWESMPLISSSKKKAALLQAAFTIYNISKVSRTSYNYLIAVEVTGFDGV